MFFKFAAFVGAIVAVAPVLLSWKSRGWVAKFDSPPYSFHDIPDLTGKTAIVTGGNSGIGLVTARELARKGAHVTLTARSVSKGEAAKGIICAELGTQCTVDVMPLDLASLEKVSQFSDQYMKKHAVLDMLILNAGVMACPFELSEDGYELQFATNHLGHFLLTNQLMPLLDKSEEGRVVTVSSSAHQRAPSEGVRFDALNNSQGYSPFEAYGQSKLANILFAFELARRLQMSGSRVTSNALHPGLIQTNLGQHIVSGVKKLSPSDFLVGMTERYVMSAAFNADDGALTQLYASTSLAMKGVTGEYLVPVAVRGTPTALARDQQLQKRLWEVSEQFTANFL